MSLGRLWIAGISPDWDRLYAHESRRRVALPVYPFDRHRYWPEARPATAHGIPRFEAPTVVADQPDQPQCDPVSQLIIPRDEIELELSRIFEEVLGMTSVGVSDSFFDLGGSSLSALSVILRLEQICDCKLSSADLLENPTVEALAQVLRAGRSPRSFRLVAMRGTGKLTPIFCIHPYGGHTTGYVELMRCLGADQPVYGIQSRGLQGEAAPCNRIEEMAADYIALIKSQQPTGPYRLVGHSMGGCIAYEMAQQLRQAGDEVALLALLDSRAQNVSIQPLYRNGEYGQMAGKAWVSDDAVILGILFPALAMNWERLRELPAEAHWLVVLEAAMQQGLLPLGTRHNQIRHLLTVTRANDEALRTYRPKAYACSVLLFSGVDGFALQFGEADLGWGDLVLGDLEVVKVPGTHHSIMAGSNVAAIARRLQEYLRQEALFV